MNTLSPVSGRILAVLGWRALGLDRTTVRRQIDQILGQEAPTSRTVILEDTILALRAQVASLRSEIEGEAPPAVEVLEDLVRNLGRDDQPRREAIQRARAYLGGLGRIV